MTEKPHWQTTNFTGRFNLTNREKAARERLYGPGDNRRISRKKRVGDQDA